MIPWLWDTATLYLHHISYTAILKLYLLCHISYIVSLTLYLFFFEDVSLIQCTRVTGSRWASSPIPDVASSKSSSWLRSHTNTSPAHNMPSQSSRHLHLVYTQHVIIFSPSSSYTQSTYTQLSFSHHHHHPTHKAYMYTVIISHQHHPTHKACTQWSSSHHVRQHRTGSEMERMC